MKTIPFQLKRREVLWLKRFRDEGRKSVRELNRAQILLLLHRGKRACDIADFIELDYTTVWRIKKRYLEKGLKSALEEEERPGQPKKYSDKVKATVIALACSDPPKGRNRWSLSLLKERISSEMGIEMNRESIRLELKKKAVVLG
jgi:transposase